ncbi:MAG TPA: caspase family protein [Aridibacter sp.]|nr:caspase family protein [Aridibacter sp.]
MKYLTLLILVLGLSLGGLPREHRSEPVSLAPKQDRIAKRALLVGISEYNKLATNKSFNGLPSVRNDIRAMEMLVGSPGYDFEIRKVQDSEATREGILKAIREHLIDSAKKGDVSLLYFSGHGSQVVNSLGGETDGKDETLVPFDVIRPVTKKGDLRDIRDKELNGLINIAAGKGVVFTAIIDSCHSGSIAKGEEDELRQLESAELDIKERPSMEQVVPPSQNGSLIYSAARDFQRASGAPYGHHPVFRKLGFEVTDTMGHFTANLLIALYENPGYAITSETLFRRVEGRMRAKGIPQRPEIDAGVERRRKTIFGLDPGGRDSRMPIEKDDSGDFYLLAGLANGLSAGNDLLRDPRPEVEVDGPRLRIRLTDVELTKSRFEVISDHTVEELGQGDLFEQVTWGTVSGPLITVWPPPSEFGAAQLMAMAEEVQAVASDRGLRIVDSPLEGRYSHLLSFEKGTSGAEWKLTLPTGETRPLGRNLTTKTLKDRLSNVYFEKDEALFVAYPPPKEFETVLGFGDMSSGAAIARSTSRKGATYVLVGRSRADAGEVILEYSWVLRSAFDNSDSNSSEGPESVVTALPVSTDWVRLDGATDSAERLRSFAGRLARVSGWLSLHSPPGSEKKFPYRLEIRNVSSRPLEDGEPLHDGEQYRFFLKADPEFLNANLGRFHLRFYTYLVAIDRNGTSVLLPDGHSDKPVDVDPLDPQPEIELTRGWRMKIGGDLGTENYVLLMTTSPLPDKSILFSEGVRTEGSKSLSDPLSQILYRIGDPVDAPMTRDGLSTPENWHVQTLTRISRGK